MQLIVESVSLHLRELELSFYGNANGSGGITSHCLSSGGEKPGLEAVSLSREIPFTVPGNPVNGITTGCHHCLLLIVFWASLLPLSEGVIPGPTGSPFFIKELCSPQEQGQR